MKKELLMLISLIGLPTLFIMTMHGGTTGAFSNEFAQLRLDRLMLYHSFPVPMDSPIHKRLATRVKEGIRAGAHEDFYGPDRLQSGDRFLDNEQEVILTLLQLSCLKPVGTPPKGRYITPSGMDIIMVNNKYFEIGFESIGEVPCDDNMRYNAEIALKKLMELDYTLIMKTVEQSKCPPVETLTRAREDIIYGNIEAALTNLRAAWSKSTYC